ncbi:MAG: glycerol-3-phosphate dehydrogenase [Bacteroidetes bacterium SW_9_63_38]|nr:MAG: glycerol-3-phosphate dehydrogenase [Bacteroidetes bacterium SW_9_63_38]
MSSITLFGAGSWGTALSSHLAAAGRDVTLWARRSEAAEKLRQTRYNPKYLRDLFIPASVEITSDTEAAAAAADVWGIAVPAPYLRGVAEQLRPYVRPDVTLVSLAKGVEKDSGRTMSQVLDDELKALPIEQIGVLYGPSHSEEVSHERFTSVVAAAPTAAETEQIRDAFMTDRMRVYLSTDVIGVEVGGSVKNVLGIAAGISDGLGYGNNAKAALATRGLTEIRRLGVAMGAEPETFSGLTGVGDVAVTCTSEHSRNRYVGEQIGQGASLEALREEMNMVAEGVYTAQAVRELADEHDLEMPIMTAVYELLFEDRNPDDIAEQLMDRPAKSEHAASASLSSASMAE